MIIPPSSTVPARSGTWGGCGSSLTNNNFTGVNFLCATAGNWIEGSPNLVLTLGGGFDYAKTYTLIENVNPASFSLGSITGYDCSAYSAQVSKVGDAYVVSFTPSAAATYAVTYNGNGHTGGTAPTDPITKRM